MAKFIFNAIDNEQWDYLEQDEHFDSQPFYSTSNNEYGSYRNNF